MEILIAMGVLLVAVVSAFSSQLTSMSLMNTSRETNVAMGDLQACMESLLIEPLIELPVAGSDYAAGQPIAAYTGLHLTNEVIVPTYPGYVPGGSVPDPLTIVLTITWQDPQGHTRLETLRSMKTR